MSEPELRTRHPHCSYCKHTQRLLVYDITIEVRQPAELAPMLSRQQLVTNLVETLGNYEPGWLTDREGSDWYISTILDPNGRVLYDTTGPREEQ